MLTTVEGKIILSAEDQTGNVFGDVQGQLDKLDKQGKGAFEKTRDSGEEAIDTIERFGKAMAVVAAGQIALDFKAAAAYDRHASRLSHLHRTIENLPRQQRINEEQTLRFAEQYHKTVVGGYGDIIRMQEIAIEGGARNNTEVEKSVKLYSDLAAKRGISGTQAAQQLESQLQTARGLNAALKELHVNVRPGEMARWQQMQQHMPREAFTTFAREEFAKRSQSVLKGHADDANRAAGATERLQDAWDAWMISQGKGAQATIDKFRDFGAAIAGTEDKLQKLGRIGAWTAAGATAGSKAGGWGAILGGIGGTVVGSAYEFAKQYMGTTPEEIEKGRTETIPGGGSVIDYWLRSLTSQSGNLEKSNTELQKFSANLKASNDQFAGVTPTSARGASGRNPLFQNAAFRFGGDLNAIKPGSYDPRGARGGLNLDLGGLPGGRFGGGGFGAGGAPGGGKPSTGGRTSGGGRVSGGGGGPAGFAGGTAKPGQQAEALAQAELMNGMSELDPQGRATIMEYLKTGGVGMDPAQLPWCAAFVNASLNRAGIKGTGSNVATSFGAWGEAVKGQAQKGDVLVEMRGLTPGMSGGHVGFATGKTRTVNGELQYEMFGGNQGDMARNKWISASKVTARRAPISAGGGTGAVAGAGAGSADTSGPAPTAITPEAYFKGRNIAGLPAGMRVNNPGNIKYTGSAYQRSAFTGLMGPGSTKDQGDPQALFSSPTAGMMSAITLARRKYGQGLNTVNKLITDPKLGWTPGSLGPGSAKSIAAAMGVDPNAPINLDDPQVMDKFMHALVMREHGKAGKLYGEEIYKEAIDRSYGARSTPDQVATDPTRPTPIEVANAKDRKAKIARSRVDVNLKLAKDLSMSKPSFERDPDMDVGVMVDRTGSNFARPGDPSYYGAARV